LTADFLLFPAGRCGYGPVFLGSVGLGGSGDDSLGRRFFGGWHWSLGWWCG
jgi:hypothetical protein